VSAPDVSREPASPAASVAPPSTWTRLKKLFGPVLVVLALVLKFFAKLKFLLIPVAKFGLPILKTGGTMILSIGFYAMSWGWQYALGFVLLIFVHECGHLVAARRQGLKVGAPVFIPFMGAFIALKDAPKDAWIEAYVGIGGPLLGALGAVACQLIYLMSGNELFRALAYSGFFLNLFNLAPIGFLDGGRIATALSPWLWVVGLVVLLAMIVNSPNFLLILILLMSLPRVFSLFRARTEDEKRYFDVTPRRRLIMGSLYFGLIAALFAGMSVTHIAPPAPVRVAEGAKN
jgi:Zn-dependent protease